MNYGLSRKLQSVRNEAPNLKLFKNKLEMHTEMMQQGLQRVRISNKTQFV